MSKTELNEWEKLIASLALVPLCADLLSDIPFSRQMKMKTEALINNCRSYDRFFMDNVQRLPNETDEQFDQRKKMIYDQQIALQRKLRNILRKYFDNAIKEK